MTQIILDAAGAGTWTVPRDWNSADNTIELLGAGGDGGTGVFGNPQQSADGGGAGGGYARYDNVDLTPGDVADLQVGTHGQGQGSGPNAPAGADTWFQVATSYYVSGGQNFPNAVGGFRVAGTPAVQFRGGNSASVADYTGSTGGGGAGGPHGRGGDSAVPDLSPFASGGTGGGGADGGGDATSSVGAPGTAGGANRLGAGAGAAAVANPSPPPPYNDGSAGTDGGGGGGGQGQGPTNTSGGGDGSFEPLWGALGPGSAGGGAGYSEGTRQRGGNAGGRGAGGGGAQGGGTAGQGTNGLIVITYTPLRHRPMFAHSRIGNPQP